MIACRIQTGVAGSSSPVIDLYHRYRSFLFFAILLVLCWVFRREGREKQVKKIKLLHLHHFPGFDLYLCSLVFRPHSYFGLSSTVKAGADKHGACLSCGTRITGVFDGPSGTWGAPRLPVRFNNR